MHSAVGGHGLQRRPALVGQVGRNVKDKPDRGDPGGAVGSQVELGVHGDAVPGEPMAGEVTTRVEGHAGGEGCHEQLRRGGGGILAAGLDGLVDEETMFSDTDLIRLAGTGFDVLRPPTQYRAAPASRLAIAWRSRSASARTGTRRSKSVVVVGGLSRATRSSMRARDFVRVIVRGPAGQSVASMTPIIPRSSWSRMWQW